jgi:hypothetical protein
VRMWWIRTWMQPRIFCSGTWLSKALKLTLCVTLSEADEVSNSLYL